MPCTRTAKFSSGARADKAFKITILDRAPASSLVPPTAASMHTSGSTEPRQVRCPSSHWGSPLSGETVSGCDHFRYRGVGNQDLLTGNG